MKQLRLFFIHLLVLTAVAALIPAPSMADELDEIYRLADQKDYDQALARLDVYLKEKPRDAQARFLKGLILTERKERDKAIQVFLDLSADFPDLPEPYNNLAVLYAEKGYYEKARSALKQAVQTHPGYATAHENLGDIYAKMASQAYTRALRLNNDNPAVRNKLELVQKMFAYPANDGEPPPRASVRQTETAPLPAQDLSAPPPPPVDLAEAEPSAVMERKAEPPPSKGPLRSRLPQPQERKFLLPPQVDREAIIAEVVKPAASPGPVAPPVAAPSKQAAPPSSFPIEAGHQPSGEALARAEVEKAVRSWALSWSSKDLDGYLAAYSRMFQVPPEFPGRQSWEARRRQIVGKAGTIRVTLTDLRINLLNDNRAQATFTQKYWSRHYKDSVRKTLSLVREEGVWKIVREYADG